MTKIKLIYDICASWEFHFIKELFSNIDCDIEPTTPEILKNGLPDENSIVNNNILVFSSNVYTFDEILQIVLRIKPLIIVHLSDEWGTKLEYTHLAAFTKLLLHQHHFNNYPYNYYTNIIQIPLGYMTNMFHNQNPFHLPLKPLLERKYKWAFIGNIKSDRIEMLDKFSKKIFDNFFGNNIKPENMFDIYNNSIFVPSGKGNVRVDCFRIYESILSGSIPVIVCDEAEFYDTFHYNNDHPPFILGKTWEDAANKCADLLNNTEQLKNIQQQNYTWLRNKIVSIQQTIQIILNNHRS